MLVGLPSDKTKYPALQVAHSQRAAPTTPDENVPGPADGHDRKRGCMPADGTREHEETVCYTKLRADAAPKEHGGRQPT